MSSEFFGSYLQAAIEDYAEDNVAAGRWPKAGALARSRAEFNELLPKGVDMPDNYLFEIMDAPGGARVGAIWFAVVAHKGDRSAHVFDVHIDPAYRRQGHATRAFKALEPLVRRLGLSSIGLHVFAHNPGAQALYASLGYAATGINMRKQLGGSDA